MTTRDKQGHWIKGASGNPAGRKPREVERGYLDLLRAGVSNVDAKAIISKAVDQAKAGDDKARKWLWDYLAGLPVQRVAPTDPSGEHEYRGIDLDRLTDEDISQLAAIAERFTGDQPGGAEA